VAAAAPRGPSRPPGNGAISKILLVDDLLALIDLQRNYLKRTTCRILTARDGGEALRVCRLEKPDLVFLDAAMPGMDGIETCRAIKTDPVLRRIAVVIVAPGGRTEECLAAGSDDVLTKPVSQDDFLLRVRRFVPLLERGESRIPASLRVEFKVRDSRYRAYTKDVSPHGVFLKTPRPLAPGTRLSLEVHLPGREDALLIQGEVRRVIEAHAGSQLLPGIGVRFVDIDPEARRVLKDFIAARLDR
jgi:uncharacterized protein (TIGR02266 family)